MRGENGRMKRCYDVFEFVEAMFERKSLLADNVGQQTVRSTPRITYHYCMDVLLTSLV